MILRVGKIVFGIALLVGAAAQRCSALDVGAMASYWRVDGGSDSWGEGVKVGSSLLSDYVKPTVRAYWFPDMEDRFNNKVDIIPVDFGPSISFNPHGKFNPFITGGSGWVFVNSDRNDSHSNIGYFAGGGLDYKITKTFGLYTEALYRFFKIDLNDRYFGDETQDFNGFSVNMGIQLHF